MRLYLLLIGLIPVLALGADFYLNQRSQAWEAGLGRTAQLIVGEALGGSAKPLVSTPQQITESAPNVWTLDGTVTRTDAGQSTNQDYRVELEQICGEAEDPACWLPRQIVVGGRSIEPRVVATASSGAQEQTIDTASLSLETTGSSQADVAIEDRPAQPDSVTRIDETAQSTPPPPPETLTGAAEVTPSAGGKPSSTATEALSQNVTQQDASAQLAAVDMTVQESLIWLIQDRLNQLGYQEPGAVAPNGTLGPGTIFAIKAYQSNYGMALDGLPSFELLDHLDRNLAQRRDGGDTKIDLAPQAQAVAQVETPSVQTATAQTAIAQAPTQASTQTPPQGTVDVPIGGETAPRASPETLQPESSEDRTDDPTSFALQKLEQEIMPAAGNVAPSIATPSNEPAQAQPVAVQQVAARSATTPEVLPASQQAAATVEGTIRDEEEADESLVFLIQDRLNRLGYNEPRPISLDGKLGPRTRAAITDYQSRHGLASNGRPSRELLDHLEAQLTGRRAGATSVEDQTQ